MPNVIFNFGDTSKEVDLKDINSVDDVASNMKEVIKIDKMKAEKDLFTILQDALDRAKDPILTHPCDVDQIENVCRIYGYEL